MTVRVAVRSRRPVDDLVSLRDALGREPELRGRITLVGQPEAPGTLGSLIEAISVALVPGGAATVLAASAVAWIRQRTTDLSMTFETEDGAKVEIEARRIRSASPAEIRDMTMEIATQLRRDPDA